MSIPIDVATERPSPISIWLHAIRPRIMPAAIAPIVVGTAVAVHEGAFIWWVALLALCTSILLQIGSNLANDAIDAKRGADTVERTGPTRMTATGLLTYKQVMNATWIALGLAMCTGIPLIIHGGWPFVALGIAAVISALAYTAGPFPIGYHGLGEVFVFLFFGLAAVTGTAYLQTGELTGLALMASIPPGAMIVGILIVNNYRDREGDALANKRTVAVRIGAKNTRIEYYIMLGLTLVTPFVFWALGWLNAWALLTVLSWPMFRQLVQHIQTYQGRQLNKTLGLTCITGFVFSVLLGIALILSA